MSSLFSKGLKSILFMIVCATNVQAMEQQENDPITHEAITRSLQETSSKNVSSEDINIALAISASEFDNPNAPILEELRELDEENELSIALEESLQSQTTNTLNTSTVNKGLRLLFEVKILSKHVMHHLHNMLIINNRTTLKNMIS